MIILKKHWLVRFEDVMHLILANFSMNMFYRTFSGTRTVPGILCYAYLRLSMSYGAAFIQVYCTHIQELILKQKPWPGLIFGQLNPCLSQRQEKMMKTRGR